MIFLTVPFAEKDQAKALGARWNAAQKKWYVPEGSDSQVFAKWNPQAASTTGSAGSDPGKGSSTSSSMMEIGLTITGAQYFSLDHGCIPWEPCNQCDAQVAARK